MRLRTNAAIDLQRFSLGVPCYSKGSRVLVSITKYVKTSWIVTRIPTITCPAFPRILLLCRWIEVAIIEIERVATVRHATAWGFWLHLNNITLIARRQKKYCNRKTTSYSPEKGTTLSVEQSFESSNRTFFSLLTALGPLLFLGVEGIAKEDKGNLVGVWIDCLAITYYIDPGLIRIACSLLGSLAEQVNDSHSIGTLIGKLFSPNSCKPSGEMLKNVATSNGQTDISETETSICLPLYSRIVHISFWISLKHDLNRYLRSGFQDSKVWLVMWYLFKALWYDHVSFNKGPLRSCVM